MDIYFEEQGKCGEPLIIDNAVERETNKLFKYLKSNNAGEYSSNDFDDYCNKHDIRLVKMVSYSPQLNGVLERMNRTVTKRVRSMLSSAKLLNEFCREARSTVCYLVNRSPLHAFATKWRDTSQRQTMSSSSNYPEEKKHNNNNEKNKQLTTKWRHDVNVIT